MRNRTIVLVAALFSLIVMYTISYQDGRVASIQARSVPEENLVVRAYFDDLESARKIAVSFEPLESNYEKGYLVLAANADDIAQLRERGIFVTHQAYEQVGNGQQVSSAPVGETGIPDYECYRTVEEMAAAGQAIAADYPQLASWSDVGDSWQKTQALGGYDLYVLKLTNAEVEGPKPKIFMTAGIHAREYAPPELVTRLAEYLVQNYGVDADVTWMLDYHEVHLMFMANPDGRKMAESSSDYDLRWWRKNTNENYCSPESNARGADLNRNFPYNWDCCGGSSSNQCSEIYHGASAASEPETQAIAAYIQDNFDDNRGPAAEDAAPLDSPGIFLDIHSSGQLLLWPWGHTDQLAPNGTQLQTLGRKLAYFNDYHPSQAIGLYPTDGTTTSFAYGDRGLASFTIELGTNFFEACADFEEDVLPANFPALLYTIKASRLPYRLPSGPDVIDITADDGLAEPGVIPGTPVELTAVVTDSRYNQSNGIEAVQEIAAAEFYLDSPPWAGGSAVSMVASDGIFDAVDEDVVGIVDTDDLIQGRHTLFVRGQDGDGNWGPISAIFLYVAEKPEPPEYFTIFLSYMSGTLGESVP